MDEPPDEPVITPVAELGSHVRIGINAESIKREARLKMRFPTRSTG